MPKQKIEQEMQFKAEKPIVLDSVLLSLTTDELKVLNILIYGGLQPIFKIRLSHIGHLLYEFDEVPENKGKISVAVKSSEYQKLKKELKLTVLDLTTATAEPKKWEKVYYFLASKLHLPLLSYSKLEKILGGLAKNGFIEIKEPVGMSAKKYYTITPEFLSVWREGRKEYDLKRQNREHILPNEKLLFCRLVITE